MRRWVSWRATASRRRCCPKTSPSQYSCAASLLEHGATALADVTGFGLVGHLGEMLAASGAEAELDRASIPLYAEVGILARDGIASTLLPENLALAVLLRRQLDPWIRAVLFDPQTSGGFLAGIPADRAGSCVARLRSTGHAHAAIIGHVGRTGLSPADVGLDVTGTLGVEAVLQRQ